MPGLRNSNKLHSSPRWFSTGVPLSASRWSACSSRAALAVSVVGVLDRLRLVEDAGVEPELGERRRVAAERAVGGQDEVVVLERGPGPVARRCRCGRAPSARGEPGRLLLPVEHQRLRHDHQGRPGPLARRAARAPARSCPAPCRRPGSRRTRTCGGSGASPAPRAGSRAARRGSPAAGRPARRPRTCAARRGRGRTACRTSTSGRDASRASSTPTWACANRTASPSTVPIAASRPYFFSQSSGSMPRLPSSRTTLDSPRRSASSRRGNGTGPAVEVGGRVEVEPVQAGADGQLELAGLTVQLAVRLDLPAGGDQLADQFRELRPA